MKMDEKHVKTPGRVSGPKASLATFIRPRDGVRIFVFARRGESKENAVKRVMRSNGAEGGVYDWTN
jgi:hypothetical protein